MESDISIIIVNYNVRHFLEQALASIQRAKQGLRVETWVVDNASVDDSLAMVRREYPDVKIIANKDNVGFSKANNQAIEQSNSQYILLLNPDTVLQEDTLVKCFEYMQTHSNTGALGVKMIDGSGQFLPESKRGFPSPWVSFCKATGLSAIFPKSKVFNQYHLGFLDEDETHQVDVLSGAFMFMRKETLDKVGLLDEDFFMYGEDIDLSYRIKSSGYDVVYLPETKIIHFKGESTKKSSVNYVKVFYQAMIIFSKKHFSGKGAGFLTALLNVAIFGRAILSLVKRFWTLYGPVLTDAILSFGSFWTVKELWERFYYDSDSYYEDSVLLNFLLYTIVILLVFAFQGIYGKAIHAGKIIRGVLISLVLSLAIYGLLNNEYRSSRAILVIGSFLFLGVSLSWRYLKAFAKTKKWQLHTDSMKRILIVGTKSEVNKVQNILDGTLIEYNIIGNIAPKDNYQENYHIAPWKSMKTLTKIEKIDEIIYCIKDLEWKDIMSSMSSIGPSVQYKMAGDDQISILGSQSKNTAGELYTANFNFNISLKKHQIAKRMLDIGFSIILLILSPILYFFKKNKNQYISNMFQVLLGNKTLVGYDLLDTSINELPPIKEGIIARTSFFGETHDQQLIHRINLLYAKDYYPWIDVESIIRSITKLGS